jgi:hypothetical protein
MAAPRRFDETVVAGSLNNYDKRSRHHVNISDVKWHLFESGHNIANGGCGAPNNFSPILHTRRP